MEQENISNNMGQPNYPLVYIRTDASSSIGFGHLMRMLVLADELRDNQFNVYFVIQNNQQTIKLLDTKGYQYFTVEGTSSLKSTLTSSDTNQFKKILSDDKKSLCIVDHPGADSQYLKKISNYCTFLMAVAVDGLSSRYYHGDIIFNQNYKAQAADINSRKNAIKLVGINYVLLRDEFILARQKLVNKPRPENILICFGGADVAKQTLRFTHLIKENLKTIFQNMEINIIVGPAYQCLEDFQNICSCSNQLKVHISPSNIETMMAKADMAIVAAGSICWELAYLGVPGLILVTADNQNRIANQLQDDGYYKNIGLYSEITDDEILEGIKTFMEQYPSQYLNKQELQKLVDGSGKKRLVRSIKKLVC